MRGKKLKYSISVAILSTMLLATPTFANPVTQNDINNSQAKVNSIENKIMQLDDKITIGMDKSQKLTDEINAQQGKIEEAKANMEKAKQDFEAHKLVYSQRLKSIQAQGQQPMITYAEILLSSDNISEFFTRSTAISQIFQSDADLLDGLKKKQQAIQDAEEQLHNQLDKLKEDQQELASEQQQIEATKQEIQTELANAKNTLQQQQSEMDAQQRAQQQAAQLLAQQQAQRAIQQSSANNTVSAAPAVNGDLADRVVATAKQYLGVPYVWGGTTPSGFDCSGFTSYVFRSVGINLPRVASAQQNVGTRISPTQVQKGDLVFMGNPAYHVGIYIGNGQWINAPETGDVVKISAYNPSSFSSAARVLK